MSGQYNIPAVAPRDIATPAMRNVNLKYHTLPADRLERATRLDLVSSGVPETALGTGSLERGTFALSPCVELSSAARASLPPVLGGVSHTFAASPSTADMVAQAYPRSRLGSSTPALARSLFPDEERARYAQPTSIRPRHCELAPHVRRASRCPPRGRPRARGGRRG